MQYNIQQFLKSTVFFIGIPLLLFIVILIILDFLSLKNIDDYKINGTITTVFIGDSHIQQAINDRLIRNSVNFSQKGESFYFSYYKIAKLLEDHPQIKKIYLGFSYHSLSSYYEDYIFGEYSKDISSRYFFILPFADKMNLLQYNTEELPGYFKNAFHEALGNTFRKNRNTILGYYENNFSHTTVNKKYTKQRLQFQFYKNEKITSFSEFNISYLEKIITLCRSRNVELIILNTPLHDYYRNGIPSIYIEKYNSLIQTNRLSIIDFHDLVLNDSCFIPDGDHVSVEGAVLVSKYLEVIK